MSNSEISRRRLMKNSLLAGAVISAGALGGPQIARSATPKLVVVGGGIGGATLARYAAKDSKGKIDVTLVEPNKTYTTCFFSNLYLGGFRTFESLQHGYDKLANSYGINVVHQKATGLNASKKQVTLADGSKLDYDRLVVAPGIDFQWNAIEGYDEAASQIHPHAYKAGPQTTLLKSQLEAMRDGGVFLMVAPPNPFRCPPGPYERVSMVANYLKNNKPKSKILILDYKDKFSKQGLFQESWSKYYAGMVEWLPAELHGGVESIDVKGKTVTAGGEKFQGDVINVIAPQKAGNIAEQMGLTDGTGWCPIKDAVNFESAKVAGVHVLGDASINGAMPKSGFSANSQAKAVSNWLVHDLTGARAFPPRFRNTCWSLVADGDAVKVGANYTAEDNATKSKDPFISKTGEDAATRSQTRDEALAWYDSITADVFG